MGNLIHARLPRSGRMALAYRDQRQGRLQRLSITGKDRSPLARGLRDVKLHATLEVRPVLAFFFAAKKPLARRAFVAERGHHRLDRRPRCWCTASEVLFEHLIDNPNLEARTGARAHDRLSLTVGGQRPEVAVEFLWTHRRGPGSLANLLDRGRLGGPLRREYQLHLRRFLIGHRIDLLVQLSLGHEQIVATVKAALPGDAPSPANRAQQVRSITPAEAPSPRPSPSRLAACGQAPAAHPVWRRCPGGTCAALTAPDRGPPASEAAEDRRPFAPWS